MLDRLFYFQPHQHKRWETQDKSFKSHTLRLKQMVDFFYISTIPTIWFNPPKKIGENLLSAFSDFLGLMLDAFFIVLNVYEIIAWQEKWLPKIA